MLTQSSTVQYLIKTIKVTFLQSTKLKSNTLNQHAGWSPNSDMAQKYIHYFGNESSETLLEAYGIVTKNSVSIDTLNPKICPNCNEGNTQDAKFCSKCKMLMSFDGYQEVLQEQQEKDKDLQSVKERMASIENLLVAIQPLLRDIKPEMLSKLQLVGMNNE
jgi:ribosomal protein L40E